MPPQTVEQRIETLEHTVTALEQLPARVAELGLQILQSRNEMHAELSAIRGEGAGGLATLRDAIQAIRGEGAEDLSLATLRDDMEALRDAIQAIRGAGAEDLSLATLRAEIRAGDEETRTLMRVLHEDLVQRIALLQEGRPAPRQRKGAGKRPGEDTGDV